ncbi:UDP-N-acetylglucosamine 1-carboxyvinyltransferase [Priestia filamentosa]|uniref:UDP-N-acetylglucosamine 1-carboxyvinyltransferase n=1 Tax=Priestia filamentosa TaxID=1402861 RepID=UPI00397BF223
MENKRTNSVIINGGRKLKGTARVQGSKNAALPILAATVLVPRKVTLYNVPEIDDVKAMLEIMEYLGATYTFEKNVVVIDNEHLENKIISDELSSKLRASSLLLGPLLARFGSCSVGMPGGCSIGRRPLNYHFDGFEHLNSTVTVEEGIIKASSNDIKGEYNLDFPSVGATQNLVSSSVYTKEGVIIRNIALEPENMALFNFLNTMGADVQMVDTNAVQVTGVERLQGGEFTIPFDRIEAGTLLVAAFATKGEITLTGVKPQEMTCILQKLMDMGAYIETRENEIALKYNGKILGANIRTGVHPAFPTDMQSQFSILMTRAEENFSVITETIFENRFRHLDELRKLSANVDIQKNVAIIYPSKLSACPVKGYDLRGSASMVIAGLIAKGATRVEGLEYMYRGYEAFVEKLTHLGADIYYIDEKEKLVKELVTAGEKRA